MISYVRRTVDSIWERERKVAEEVRKSGSPGAYGAANEILRNVDRPGGLIDRWFYSKVRGGGDFDFKKYDSDEKRKAAGKSIYEEFGNFAYGAMGKEIGYSLGILQRMAGWVQRPEDNSSGEKAISEAAARLGITGKYPYGDELKDAEAIARGVQYQECRKKHPKKE